MMKKTGRFLALLMILALLLAEIPAMADEAIARTDPNEIDTVFEEITSPDEFKLGKYLYVNDTSLQKVEFTAPKTGTYYLYQRRIDNVSPMITVYTSANDPVPAYRMEGTAGQPLVMDVYLKKENKTVVTLDRDTVQFLGTRIIEDDMVSLDGTSVRHDAMKTAFLIFSYLMGK